MKIVKIISQDEFEVEGEFVLGDLIRSEDVLAVVISIYQEASEYSDYLGRLEVAEIKEFLPDLVEGRRVAKCLALSTVHLEDVFTLPRVGAEVSVVSKEELRDIHLKDGKLKIPYLVKLLRSNIDVARRLILKLIEAIPEEKDLLEIILAEIEYNRMRGVEL